MYNENSYKKENEEDIITLVDVDFAEYRRRNDMRTKNSILTTNT